MRHINEVSESAEVSAAVDDAGGPAPRAAFRPHSAADPVEDDSGGFFSSTKMIVMLIGIAAGCLLMMIGILLCVIKLRRKREQHQLALHKPMFEGRSLPDASAMTSSASQPTSKPAPSSKHRTQEDVAAPDTRIAPEASALPDRIPEIIALEPAGAPQPDPENILLSHDFESALGSQGCVEHLEVRAYGTGGGASMGSSHQHHTSSELCEVFSVNLSENAQGCPEHLHCEEQPSGSWNLSAFDEAAAQMQGSEKSPHLTSALNDDFEYSLPANLKLVGGSGSGEEGGEKLNTAFERRVLRRLDRFLSTLPAPDKAAEAEASLAAAAADGSGEKKPNFTYPAANKSIIMALQPPQHRSCPAPVQVSTSQGDPTTTSLATAPHWPPTVPQERVVAPGLRHWPRERLQMSGEDPTFMPPGGDVSAPDSGQSDGCTSPPKSAARRLLESSGMPEPKRSYVPCRPFRLLPPLEERASQESLSFATSATLSCSTAQSLSGAPDSFKTAQSGSIRTASSGSIKPSSSGSSTSAARVCSAREGAPSSLDRLLRGECPEELSAVPGTRRIPTGAAASRPVPAAAQSLSAASELERRGQGLSGPPAAVPRALRPHFKVPSKPLSAVTGQRPISVHVVHKTPPPLSQASSASAVSEELPSHHRKSSRHSRTSSDSGLEVLQEAGAAPLQALQPHVYKNQLFQSQSGQECATDTHSATTQMPPLVQAMCETADKGRTCPTDHTSTDRSLSSSRAPKATGKSAAAFYRSPTSSAPVIQSVCASSDSFLTHSGSGDLHGSLGYPEGDTHGAHALAAQPDTEGAGEVHNPIETANAEDRGLEGGSSSSVLQSSSNLYITS